jgi:TM2 domain-containing membrane protein YozV
MKHLFLGLLFSLLTCFSVKANVAGIELASEFYVNDVVVETMFAGASEVQAITYDAAMDQISRLDLNQVNGMAKTSIAPKDNEQLVAILLCFFLGGWAVHRVYLGSTPLMILWYFLTCGGIFGIVPLIDFFMLIINGTDSFVDSDKFFSW